MIRPPTGGRWALPERDTSQPVGSLQQRGPSGRAPAPPPWLHTVDLPIDTLPAGAPLFRVHRVSHGAVFFGPGPGVAPTYRFDSLRAGFGVLYAGLTQAAALVETLLRNPARRMVAYREITDRAMSILSSPRPLRVVRLHGNGLQQVGCDNAISTGPYDVCGAWADALWDHPDNVDGIAYQSRHDPHAVCLAVFERTDLALRAEPPVRLLDQIGLVAGVLDAYGKSITDAE